MYISDLAISYLLLSPVSTAQQSRTKSNSCCYHPVIPTGKNSRRLSPIFDNIFLGFVVLINFHPCHTCLLSLCLWSSQKLGSRHNVIGWVWVFYPSLNEAWLISLLLSDHLTPTSSMDSELTPDTPTREKQWEIIYFLKKSPHTGDTESLDRWR